MARFVINGAVALASFSLLSCAVARAELPPGAYEQLLKDAQEVYRVRVDKVEPTNRDASGVQHFACDATILSVERSRAGRLPDQKIQFASYYVPPEVSQRGFVGPKSPPLLTAGWQGTVYLDPPQEGNVLKLAAYGRSFVPSGLTMSAPVKPNNPAALGIMARPAAGGGMVVTSVRPDSLADDLGVRPGDRLTKVNDRDVNAPPDVKAALESDPSRVAINLVRRQKTLSLTLAR
jgi:hypothetical protein